MPSGVPPGLVTVAAYAIHWPARAGLGVAETVIADGHGASTTIGVCVPVNRPDAANVTSVGKPRGSSGSTYADVRCR